ncbi:MAG: hypothetical protein PF545_06710 [Elusimicrobia bacterium]|jgi:hypothetical protein|nr:hypothetical protein [Elusimicrobiota bacterium]
MSIEKRIKKISNRIEKFLGVNTEVGAFDLKFHLNCRTSELLLALGVLAERKKISLHKDKNDIKIISKKLTEK